MCTVHDYYQVKGGKRLTNFNRGLLKSREYSPTRSLGVHPSYHTGSQVRRQELQASGLPPFGSSTSRPWFEACHSVSSRDRHGPRRRHTAAAALALEGHVTPGDLELSRQNARQPRRAPALPDQQRNGRKGPATGCQRCRTHHPIWFLQVHRAQGIVIDPRDPDEATVFALLVIPGSWSATRSTQRGHSGLD